VRLGVRGVWLRGVTIESAAPPRVSARLDAVLVPYGGGVIEVHGGRVMLRGSPNQVLEAVRGKRGADGGGGGGRELSVDGVDLAWADFGGSVTEPIWAWGVAFERSASRERVRADRVKIAEKRANLEVVGADATLSKAASRQVTGASARSLDVFFELGEEHAEPVAAPKAVVPASTSPAASEPRWSAALVAARSVLGQALAEGSKLEVQSLRAQLAYRRERLGFGPSRVSLGRDARDVMLEVKPRERPAAGITPLSVGLRLPLDDGNPTLEIEGGPVALGALGVREGDLGLRRVRDATLEAHVRVDLVPGGPGSGALLRGSGSGKLANLTLARPELSPDELRGVAFGFRAAGEARLDGSLVAVDDAELAVGDVRLSTSLTAERDEEGRHLKAKGGVPLASCDAMLASLPKVLVADLGGLSLEGTFALTYEIDFQTAHPEKTRVLLDVKNDCHVKSAPAALSPVRFRSAWVREVKGADGQSVMIQSGPGAQGWVRYEDISHYMEVAVLVCEDGGFYRHRGFDFRAIERALTDDIRVGRFLRGASTISMQLAKNLYLGREKTLARKIQEALLTLLLEEQLEKKELMELYLNVVELGPGIYGVGPAAEHYFKTSAKDLTLGQALYLASILPDPTRQHFEPDGDVTERWSEYLKKLMRIAKKVDRISDDELEAGLAEEVGFRQGTIPPAVTETESSGADGSESLDAPTE
jgi:hypothetical protein